MTSKIVQDQPVSRKLFWHQRHRRGDPSGVVLQPRDSLKCRAGALCRTGHLAADVVDAFPHRHPSRSVDAVAVGTFLLYVSEECARGKCGQKRTPVWRCGQELTQGSYWQVADLLLTVILSAPIAILLVLSGLEIMRDHWVVDASSGVVFDVMSAYVTVCLFCAYEAFSRQTGSESPATP